MGQDKETYVKSTLATEYASSPLPGKGQLYNPIKLEGDLLSSSGETTVSTTSCSSSSSSSSITAQSEVASMPSSPRSLSSSQSLTRQGSTSKILLFHPSIISPSRARKLEGVKYVTVLYNPKSGNKRGEKVMRQVVAKFQRSGLQVTTVQLEYKNHATEFCKNKVDFTDMEVLCVIGGDGTFHEVVNGLMQHPLSRIAPHCLPILSVVPAGTGNSMVRELQGIASVRVSTDEVLFGTSVAIDILKVTILAVKKEPPVNEVPQPPKREGETCEAFKNEEEYIERVVGGKKYVQKEVIYAFNSIHWGLASRVLEKAEKLRWMGHGIRYTVASVMEMVQGSSTRARIVLEDANGAVTEYENDTFCLVIANNIGTAGKGMTMAPKAKINDGLVDILLIRSHKPWHLMKLFEKLYNGTHVDLPYVEYKQVRKFSIFPYKKTGQVEVQGELEFAEEVVDVDGELKGFTPFECEVLPLALELII